MSGGREKFFFDREVSKRMAAQLDDPGVVATDFRGGVVEWSPPSIGYYGETAIPHRLGRIPSGLFLIAGDVVLDYLADAGQRALWTRESVSIYVQRYHHLTSGRHTLASSATDNTLVFDVDRPSACQLVAVTTFQDNGTADRPPLKVLSFPTSGGRIIGVSIGLANGGTLGAYSSTLNTMVRTDLHTSDVFRWLVV